MRIGPVLTSLAASLLIAGTAPAQNTPATLGTTQLPGDNGKIGQTLTLGFDLPLKLNFTLRSAEYSLGRLTVENRLFAPAKDQKLLILKFTAHNPNKVDLLMRGDTLRFIGVDSEDTNHLGSGCIAKTEESKEAYGSALKPAQKVELVTGILVPAGKPIPKLIVQFQTSKRVVRYALNGVVKALQPPFAAASDTGGATAAEPITGQLGTAYPLGPLDVTVVQVGDITLARAASDKTQKCLAVTITVRVAQNYGIPLRYDTFRITLANADGIKQSRVMYLVGNTSEMDAGRSLEPGETATARFVLKVPTAFSATSLTLAMGTSHTLAIPLSQ